MTQHALPGVEHAHIVERDAHPISRQHISPNALKVLYRLEEEGYPAFLVGGGVRDLLLGGRPKDFDVATSATPEQIKRLFRNSRIIGRRFKIVHVRFGREIIEVTTFRAHHDPSVEIADHQSRRTIKHLDSAHSSSGMILRDNIYGDINEDAVRRDFTVNALYYTVNKFQLLDFCGGLEDLDKRQIRMIGDPATRYREDPVRMLRAVRFAAKLGFDIEENTGELIPEFAYLLEGIAPARLFDESIKLLTTGHAQRTFALLQQYDLATYLFGPTLEALENPRLPEPYKNLLDLALINTDNRLAANKTVTPAFLYAALLWPVLQCRLMASPSPKPSHPEFLEAANIVLAEQLDYCALPKRFAIAAREIWELQLRLIRRNRRSINSAFNHPRFRAAYDFLLLREQAGESLDNMGQWWTDFQNGDTKQQSDMVSDTSPPRKRRRRKRRKRPQTSAQ